MLGNTTLPAVDCDRPSDGNPLTAAAAMPILTGFGELRRSKSAEQRYEGHLVLGEGTIVLTATVGVDDAGRYFDLSATLDPGDFTQTELDRLLTSPCSRGAGLGGPRRLPPVGPIEDDPIPFEAA